MYHMTRISDNASRVKNRKVVSYLTKTKPTQTTKMRNGDSIDWASLSANPSADNILNAYKNTWGLCPPTPIQMTVEFRRFCGLPDYDYDRIKTERAWLQQELNEYLFHPRRIRKWLDAGNEIEDYLQ